jgi:putative ABC transport system permease protein
MFQSYLRIGLRNLLKNKLFSAINIGGMAISISCFLIIALFIADELRFDKHVEDADLKFRVYNDHFNDDGSRRKGAMVPPMIAPTLQAEFPEVDYYTRFLNINGNVLFEAGDKKLIETKGGYADTTVFRMFSLKLTEGDLQTALKEPQTVAISKTLASKYFGDKPAVGETIEISDQKYSVDAVFEDFDLHFHLQLNFFLSMHDLYVELPDRMQRWGWSQFHTYIKLKEGADAAALEAKLEDFARRNAWPSTKPNGGYYIPHLMPMQKIHLYASDHSWDIAIRGNIQTVYILAVSAFFILIIAILNFVNLSTARAINRVKEVGVRKVVGAFRSQLIGQFISESVVIAFIALLIGGLVAELTLPVLNAFTEKSIPTGIFLNPLVIILLVAFALVVGIAAGAYPALYISGYKPAHILSNKQSGRSGKILLRKALVVLQFVLSFVLICASFVVSQQHEFMRNKDMGFMKDNLVVLSIQGDMKRDIEVTKNAFLAHPGVLSATMGYGLPGQAFAGDGIRDNETKKDWHTSMLTIDHDYVKTMGLRIIAGRDFSKDIASDERHAFIVSETAARMLGHADPKDALNHELAWTRWDAPDSLKAGKVIGVIEDLHLNSLHENITPVVLQVYPFAFSTLTLRIKPDNIPATLAHLESRTKACNVVYLLHCLYHFCCLSGVIWTGCLQHDTAIQGDWNPESAWGR